MTQDVVTQLVDGGPAASFSNLLSLLASLAQFLRVRSQGEENADAVWANHFLAQPGKSNL